jgi:predicted HicB family RNase H-like nuclease
METRLGFRISQSLHEQVLKACQENEMSKSDFILESIQRNLAHIRQSPPVVEEVQ